MIERNLRAALEEAAGHYPVVTVTGPRQSGKTTLCQMTFPEKRYVSLEEADVRDYVRRDPRGFLAEVADGAIIDEVQHAPELPGYLQGEVDGRPEPGRFVITGSQHFGLTGAISQSLAGRSAVLELLPLALDEVRRFESPPDDLITTLWTGAYPRIHDRGIPPDRWLSDYVTTYVQRDVRQVLAVGDLEAFTTFVRLAAGRTGRVLNLSALGADAGVSHHTARSWLSVLEAGYLCFRLPGLHRNLRKQLVKSPKLHFLDSGLICNLLGIRDPAQLRHHPLRGEIFESWVASEILKAYANRGVAASLHHFRQSRGLEVDLVIERADSLHLVETKSASTISESFLRPLRELSERLAASKEPRRIERVLVHGGDTSQRRSGTAVVSWRDVAAQPWVG